MTFEPGYRIGDYEVLSRLGAGGLGVVYKVRHVISQRSEAMKILLPEQMGTAENAERFLREVRTLARLNHMNIARLHTAFYHKDQLAMVMELIEGETLRDRRQRAGITLPQVLHLVSQVLDALVYAHELGVVHRDIKPSNVMIERGDVAKLLDFGIAITEQAKELTQTGYLVGSVSYMAPEQLSGNKATIRCDLYSVGVLLYELLTGMLPIQGATTYEIISNHIQQVPVPPHQVAAQIPRDLSDAVMRALEKDPAKRYASASEFLNVLRSAASMPLQEAQRTVPLPASATRPISASPLDVSGRQGTMEHVPLDEISRKLAVYIGPVARLVVKRLAAQSADLETLYREAARQIPSETDRVAFLRSRKP
jgi:eukaryotic-like serine/threonine-protein kinase